MKSLKAAGLVLSGGRKNSFFLSILECYPDSKRWFLRSILQAKEGSGDEALIGWIEEFGIENLTVDFPLSRPPCGHCDLACPGMNVCPQEEVILAQERVGLLLQEGALSTRSKAFRRKMKKGFLPYWNRSLDTWVWENYGDPLFRHFNGVFGSFDHSSFMLLSYFDYLRRHFPKNLSCLETSPRLCLIELLRGKIISSRQLCPPKEMEMEAQMRVGIAAAVEEKLDIFIYDRDLDLMTKNPRAFNSFILALAGQRAVLGKTREIPNWCGIHSPNFVVPLFS
ncbi:MAG: hypothetical protein OXB88_01010 [Bacteriovoracales bacterium]|nr:hypothetical protein [Bacteriovoracales bacterium]